MAELGEPAGVGLSSEDDEQEIIVAKVIEVNFNSDVKACRNKNTIDNGEWNWKIGEDIADGIINSKRPAVYRVKGAGGDRTATIKVKITKSNVSGKGTLRGNFGLLEFEGQCDLSAGEHDVKVKVIEIPEGIQWYRGNIIWGLETSEQSIALGTSRSELFFIFATPIDLFQDNDGVWIEALRLLCNRARVKLIDVEDKKEAVAKITRYCHDGKSLKYESKDGGMSKYGDYYINGEMHFKFSKYISRSFRYANCYDQAAAVQTFSGCLGIELTWIYLEPYGFITKTHLLGYGQCNNPFFRMNGTPKLIGINDVRRTGFGNHAFCEYTAKIFDACAGPHLGIEDRVKYVQNSIDTVTILYNNLAAHQHLSRPGTATAPDLVEHPGVIEVK